MITSRVVTVCRHFGSRTFATAPPPRASVNRQVHSRLPKFWYQLRSLIVKNSKKPKPNVTLHPLVKWTQRHPDSSPISYWSRLLSKRFLWRGHFLAFGLVGVVLQDDGKTGPTLLTRCDEEEAKLSRIRSLFSKIWYEEHPQQEHLPFDFGLDKLTFSNCIAKGCNAAVYEAKVDETKEPVAVKMMFNYTAETNAAAVLKAMKSECVPFPGHFSGTTVHIDKERFKLPYHPNIIDIKGIFADWTPLLADAYDLYPSALPARLNRDSGLGRNMTLFLVMKRYDESLKEYLSWTIPSNETALVMLIQLMEGVDFLRSQNVCHRDLKSDNLLLDLSHGKEYPRLVISDFGCCLTSLSLYYPSDEISKGGNIAHMAPEVISAKAGPLSVIDYSSADLWASAAIAYEMWGYRNPALVWRSHRKRWLGDKEQMQLENISQAHQAVNDLLKNILLNSPKNRPSTRTAVVLCNLLLFVPSRHQKIAKALKPHERTKYLLHYLTKKKYKTVKGSNPILCDLMIMLLAQVTYKDMFFAVQYL